MAGITQRAVRYALVCNSLLVKIVAFVFPKSGTACRCVCSHPNVEQLFCVSLDCLLLHSSYCSDLPRIFLLLAEGKS